MINHWLRRANEIVEKEVLLVRNGADTNKLFHEMPSRLPVIFTYNPKSPQDEDYFGKIGVCHTIRLHNLGIEGVLKTRKKFHRYPLYVLHNLRFTSDQYWVVVYDGSI